MGQPTSIRELLWAVYEREGFRSINEMARAKGLPYVNTYRWMTPNDRQTRRPQAAQSLELIARATGTPLEEVLRIALNETTATATRAPARPQARKPAMHQEPKKSARTTATRLLVQALVRRFGNIDEAERELVLPGGTLLGLYGVQLEHMTLAGLREVADDVGLPLRELVERIEQARPPERKRSR